MPLSHRLDHLRRGGPRFGIALSGLVLAIALAACQGGGDPLSPESAAILANPPDKPPPVVKTSAANSSIPVLVNDVPITEYDIAQRSRLNKLGRTKSDRKSVIDELINETLEDLEAQRHHIAIPDSQIDAAFAQIASNVKLTPANLTKALNSQGIDADSLKKRLRGQMIWQTLVQQRTAAKATVKNEDVTAQLVEQGDLSKITLTQFTLQQIIFVVPSGSAPAAYTQRRREAEAFRQRWTGCDNALAQAQALRGVVVKDIGRRDSSQLTGPQGDLIKKTPAGKTIPPDQTDDGIEVIAVCATKDIQTSAGARADVENSLYLKQAADLGKDYLKSLRDIAIIEYR